MVQIFSGEPQIYPQGHIISDLLAFLKKYPDYYPTVLRVLFNVKRKDADTESMIKREIQVAKLGGVIINTEQIDHFKDLLSLLYSKEKNRGNFFNQLVTEIGPFLIQEKDHVNESCINDQTGEKISPKNYDVIYFNSNSYPQLPNLNVELIECKITLDNYFYNSYQERLRTRGKERLQFFEKTRDTLEGCRSCEIILVTLQSDVIEVANLTEKEGYSWVRFIKWGDLMNAVRRKFSRNPNIA